MSLQGRVDPRTASSPASTSAGPPSGEGDQSERKISLVLPVYNERDNIAACLRGIYAALATEPHEILVCYDFDEDNTLAAIAAMPDAPPTLRLVRNRLGKGAANAIRAGFAAARGDVVVTTMADLCDPPAAIPRLAAKVRDAGAAVVSGSRYMKGGSQSGGPWLKQQFSRWAGLTMRWFAGIGTHDPTNNFRAYSRDFLARTQIESKTAFDIGLELTVKAHLAGDKVDQVPTSWRDRSAGESRFQMWKWMPNYLRWYLAAMLPPLFVWGIWLGAFISANWYLYNYASGIPFWDDIEMAGAFGPDGRRDFEWFWSLHNEHRIPIPRLIYVTLVDWTHDFRAPMYAEVAVLGILAAAMLLAVRKIRGRTSYTDAFFPLLWLHWGNHENLLMGFQISLMLPSALGCMVWVIAAAGRPVPKMGAIVALAVCLWMLPLCGGHGLTQVPALTAWLGLAGFFYMRSSDLALRRKGRWMSAFALVSCLLVAFYFYGYTSPPGQEHVQSFGKLMQTTEQFLTLSIGPAARQYWPYSAWGVFAVCGTAIWLLVRIFQKNPAERFRTSAILAGMAGIVSMGLAAGYARAGNYEGFGFATRYVTLPSPILCGAYFAWCLYGPPAFGRFIRFSLYTTMAMLFIFNARAGQDYAGLRMASADRFARDIHRGLTIEEIAANHWQDFYPSQEGFQYRLKLLAQAGFIGFLGDPEERHASPETAPTLKNPYFMMHTRPFSGRSTKEIFARIVDGKWVVMVPPEGELHFTLSPAATTVDARFGIHPLAWDNPQNRSNLTDGVRFVAEFHPFAGSPQVLYERVLEPATQSDDRGFHAVSIELPEPHEGHLVLRTTNVDGKNDEMDAAFWTDIVVQ